MRLNELTSTLTTFLKKPMNLFLVTAVILVIWLISRNFSKEGFKVGAPSMTLFYSPTCGYCEDMMPEWDKFASQNPDMRIQKIDCKANPKIAEDNNISSYPTILKRYQGQVGEVYKGERTAEAFTAFMKGD